MKEKLIQMLLEVGIEMQHHEDVLRRVRTTTMGSRSIEELQKFADLIRADEREACAKEAGEFARKWWSIHCASNKHMETTRKAHDDFCALEVAIRARGNP